jgi:hypothetical protein
MGVKMARKSPGPNLQLIADDPEAGAPRPPGSLGEIGTQLWSAVTTNYEFSDAASFMVLYQSCSAVDRAEACRAIIDQDGELLRTKVGVRSHPLLRDEVANRALACRLLARLGLDLEPIRGGPGRPPGFA